MPPFFVFEWKSTMSEAMDKTYISRWHTLVLPGIFTLIVLIILVTLGVWQLQRLAWKEALIARIDARTHANPVAIAPEILWPKLQWNEEEYRPVQVTGKYLYQDQVFVHANAVVGVGSARMGYFVLTPLQQENGSIIIINRGFIPLELKQDTDAFAEWQLKDQSMGPVTVTGLLRSPQERGWFVPEDVTAAGEWFTRDPIAIGQAKGLTRIAPFMIDAASGSVTERWPMGGLTVVSFPNNHLDYAFTWFGLAVVLLVIFIMYARKSLRVLP